MWPRWCGVFRVEVREARTVHILRRTLMGASAVGLATLLSAATMTSFAAPAGAASVPAPDPQFAAAQSAATWVAGQQAANGTSAGPSRPRSTPSWPWPPPTSTPRGHRPADLRGSQRRSYITVDSADGPGQLANLILDAHAMGVDPTNFGGTNLVTRLLATEQTVGADAGLFGTEQR